MNRFRLLKLAPGKNRKLKKLNNRILGHAMLAAVAIVLTIVLVFPMAAAWYSNVVEVGSVEFQAQPWGFSGTVSLGETLVTAAPGDSGPVTLVVSNPSDAVIAMTVGASKLQMVPEMQQRIYFYVDAASLVNGEMVEKTYLSANAGVDYTILPGRTISMSADQANVTPIYWMWVYDMLGYYVQGKWEGDQFVASEYLRPVEYDYDRAVFDEAGNLVAVDSYIVDGAAVSTPVADFVEQISQADGYAGAAQADENHPGWYQISVNENGSGVWMYLCTRAEIDAANLYDTKLGTDAFNNAAETFRANLLVTGQKKELVSQTIHNAQQLEEALTSGTSDLIELSQSVELTNTVAVAEGREVIIDLNGHTLTMPATSDVIDAQEGATVIVTDGQIEGGRYAVRATGADVTLDNVQFVNVTRAIAVYDNQGSGTDSQIRMTGCTVDATEYGMLINGNGSMTPGKTLVVIEDCVIESDMVAIGGNGNTAGTGRWGTEIIVTNSKLVGYYSGVYHPQANSEISLIHCEVSGMTGVAAKAGVVNIIDSQVTGTKTPGVIPDQYGGSGAVNTGDAVYVECNYTWATVTVNISGNSVLHSVDNAAIRKYKEEDSNGTFVITGGTFTGANPSTLAPYVPEGYEITEDGTTNITVSKAQESGG